MFIPTTQLLAFWGLTTTAWLVLWTVLAAVTVLLLVLLRTRWSGARPWRKCAILSLWVHVLLAVIATTVRIVTGAPGIGADEPIRVSVTTVVDEQSFEENIEEGNVPEWEQPTKSAVIAPEPEPPQSPELEPAEPGPDAAVVEKLAQLAAPVSREPAPPLEAPSLLTPPAPPEAVETGAQEQLAEPAESTENEQITPETQPPSPPNKELAETETASAAVENPTPPTTYADRFAVDRQQVVEQRGGSEQTERAVRAALGWLADAQAKNGGWDASKFGAGQERRVLGEDRRGAGANADAGVTGLALLAFLGAGHTHVRGMYAAEVGDALEYLRQRQRADGALFGDAQLFAQMYCHSMATFAVCEAYALTKDARLEPMARSAVRYALSMQHPTDGGWRYRRGDTGDTSQLGWQLMALKSAHLAKIHVPEVTWLRVERFLRRVRRGQAGGLAAYRPDGPASRTMTAEALFCRQLMYQAEAIPFDPAATLEALDTIAQELPTSSRRNLYYWYYATLALYENQNQSAAAAAVWGDWNHALTTTLLTTQQDDGSWSEATVWGGYGGRVYTTALSAMCLEVYYRYSPSAAPSEVAGRKGWHSIQR